MGSVKIGEASQYCDSDFSKDIYSNGSEVSGDRI